MLIRRALRYGPGTPAIQPIQIATAPNYMATGQSGAVGTNRRFIARRPIYVGNGGASELIASYANTFATRNAESGNDITVVSAYLEKGDASSSVQLTFDSGATTSKTIAWGVTDVQSDRILPSAFGLATFPANSLWWERIVFEVPLTTDKYVGNSTVRPNYTGFKFYSFNPATFPALDASGTGALDGTGKTDINGAGSKCFSAIWLGRALVSYRSYLGTGDSFTRDSDNEAGTTTLPLRLFGDTFERALVNEACTQFEPFLNTGVYGSGITNYTTAADARQAYYKYATDFHCEYMLNDQAAGAAAIQAKLLLLWGLYKSESPGCRIWRVKPLSSTTSTDSWATEANQTVGAPSLPGGFFPTLFDWIDARKADGTIHGIIPWGRARGVTDFYKWRVNDNVTNWSIASLHPSPYAGVPLMAAEGRTIMLPNASGVPSQPVLTVTATDTTITAVWTQPGQATSDHIVEISPAGADTWTALHTYEDTLAHIWRGLTPSTSYDVRVTPVNYHGNGTTSAVTTIATTTVPTLLADTLSQAPTALYSTRRLKGTFNTGFARGMRTSDRSEIDIPWDANGDIDEAFLAAWANGSNVLLKRRYDQSGNGYIQSAPYTSYSVSNWPYLVTAGVIYRLPNGKPTENMESTRTYQTTTLSGTPSIRSTFSLAWPRAYPNILTMLGGSNSGGYQTYLGTDGRPRLAKEFTTDIGTMSAGGAIALNAVAQVGSTYDNTGPWTWRKNGALVNSGSSAQTFTASRTSGYGNSGGASMIYPFEGGLPEQWVFDGALLSAPDTAIVEGGRTYFGAP